MYINIYICNQIRPAKILARSFSRFRLQPPNRCNQIRPPYVCLEVCLYCNLSATSCNQVRPPYNCLEVCLCCNLSATSCNQIRPPYDRHTSVWRSVYGCNRLQPDTTAIRLQPDTLQPPYVCLEVCLFSCLVVSGFSCCNRSATAIRLQPPYVCNQERRPPYVIHVIGDHKICLRYRRYRRYRTLEKLRAGEALFFVLYIIYII